MSFSKWIQETFSCCLHCGSFQSRASQFCLRCESDLWKMHPELTEFYNSENMIRGWALFSWFPNRDRKVSKLMMALKGGDLKVAFHEYAQAFIRRFPMENIPQNSVLVPCPSQSHRNHSLELARAYSKILQIPVADALKMKTTGGQQKSKSKQERQGISMTCEMDLMAKYVIFIDDIVTTGTTAGAARKAIDSEEGFEVWCLAYRRQLAT